MGTGIRSAIMAAAASITLAIANCSHGFVLTEPNSVPVRPASEAERRVGRRQADHVDADETNAMPTTRPVARRRRSTP